MAAFIPFLPGSEKGQAGTTLNIALGAGAATSQLVLVPTSLANGNGSVLVTMINASGNAAMTAYLRMTVESSTVITATATDTPIFCTTGPSSYVRLFASPNEAGAYSIAVIVTATPAVVGSIMYFTPGQGGT
jgi:hypothetical protein